MPRFSKKNKTYRQNPHVALLIERAAQEAGVSESDIVDECVLSQVQSVVRRLMRQQQALREPEVQRALVEFITHVRTHT